MNTSIGLLNVFADVVILLALATAVASPRVSRLVRLAIATFAFMCAWLVTAVFDAMRAPGWTIFVGEGVIMVSIVVISATVHFWSQAGDGDAGGGQRGPHGGGGPRREPPDAPQHPGAGSTPGWWPDFERQLATYVAEDENEKRQPAAPVT